jgi:hypothetical protein
MGCQVTSKKKRKNPTAKRKRKKTSHAAAQQPVDKPDHEPSQAIALREIVREAPRLGATIDPLTGDLPGVTLRNEAAVIAHFERIDPRLADAWRRDVVVHEGPITLRRIMSSVFGGGGSFGGATHYAYVDRRLLWYLKHDPSDPLGARWDGYLARLGDAPPGTIAVCVGTDFVAKKCVPQLSEGER